jgi:hypothetical protein
MGSSRRARQRTTLGSAGVKLFWCGSVFMEICLLITLVAGPDATTQRSWDFAVPLLGERRRLAERALNVRL